MPLLLSHVITAYSPLVSESEACAQPCSRLQWSQSKCPAHNFTSTFVTRPFLACHDLQGKVGVQTPRSPCWEHRVQSWLSQALLLLLPGVTPTFGWVRAAGDCRAKSPQGCLLWEHWRWWGAVGCQAETQSSRDWSSALMMLTNLCLNWGLDIWYQVTSCTL